jgi:hypothetical protein
MAATAPGRKPRGGSVTKRKKLPALPCPGWVLRQGAFDNFLQVFILQVFIIPE